MIFKIHVYWKVVIEAVANDTKHRKRLSKLFVQKLK